MSNSKVLASFDAFHDGLGAAIVARGAGVVGEIGAGRSLTLSVDGVALTYATLDGQLSLARGDAGDVAAELDTEAFHDLVAENWSVFGLLYANRLRVTRGSFDAFARWEPALQHLWFDRPLYDDAARAALVDRNGAPLDISRSFTLDDVDDDIVHFLHAAGFVVLRGVFRADEIARFNEVVAQLRATASPNDGRSWWAQNRDGADVCCRLTYVSERSEVFASMHLDPRIARIASWHGAPLRPSPDRLDGYTIVMKNPSIVAGLSDLPWHRDCGMGGHALLCPSLNIGVQLDRADASNGQLLFLAGSHHHTNLPTAVDKHPDWPVVGVVAEPGDVTVHYAHVLHVAPPPLAEDASRKTMYIGFNNPAVFDVIPAGKGYNDVVFTHGDGHVRSVEQLS